MVVDPVHKTSLYQSFMTFKIVLFSILIVLLYRWQSHGGLPFAKTWVNTDYNFIVGMILLLLGKKAL